MTHRLWLMEGTRTISLTTGKYRLLQYTPAQAEGTGAMELPDEHNAPVVDEIQIEVLGDNPQDLQANWAALEEILNRAARAEETGAGERVYLRVQMSGETESWRSPVLSGRIIPADTAWRLWANNAVEATVLITRRNYFEALSERRAMVGNSANTLDSGMWIGVRTVPTYAEATLSSQDKVRVLNHDDSDPGHDNWAHVESDQVVGTLPTPARVVITSQDPALLNSPSYSVVWLGHHVDGDPAYRSMVYEAEDGSHAVGTRNEITNSDASGGSYLSISWTTSSLTPLWYITVPAGALEALSGLRCMVLARFMTPPASDIRIRAYLASATGFPTGSYDVARGPMVQMDGQRYFWHLGSLPFPPALRGIQDVGPLALHLEAIATSGSGTVDLDFVALLPTQTYRVLELVPGYVSYAQGDQLIDDAMEEVAYYRHYVSGVPESYPIYATRGPGIWLYPGRDQRIHLWAYEGSFGGQVDITREFDIELFYRPRRRTL